MPVRNKPEPLRGGGAFSLTPALSLRRGRSIVGAGKEPMRDDFSQRGVVMFPLLGERVRVRASLLPNLTILAQVRRKDAPSLSA